MDNTYFQVLDVVSDISDHGDTHYKYLELDVF